MKPGDFNAESTCCQPAPPNLGEERSGTWALRTRLPSKSSAHWFSAHFEQSPRDSHTHTHTIHSYTRHTTTLKVHVACSISEEEERNNRGCLPVTLRIRCDGCARSATSLLVAFDANKAKKKRKKTLARDGEGKRCGCATEAPAVARTASLMVVTSVGRPAGYL